MPAASRVDTAASERKAVNAQATSDTPKDQIHLERRRWLCNLAQLQEKHTSERASDRENGLLRKLYTLPRINQ